MLTKDKTKTQAYGPEGRTGCAGKMKGCVRKMKECVKNGPVLLLVITYCWLPVLKQGMRTDWGGGGGGGGGGGSGLANSPAFLGIHAFYSCPCIRSQPFNYET